MITTVDTAAMTDDEYVRWLSRCSKAGLRKLLYAWAEEHGRRWIIGGPEDWSHDELVAGLMRVRRGEQP
jgi:hypothetical protein